MSEGTAKFWLDGGYDRELVEACRLHPDHGWETLRLGDILRPDELPPHSPDEPMTVCRVCGVPRCGESDFADCNLPRHHPEDHLTKSGVTWPIGGTRS